MLTKPRPKLKLPRRPKKPHAVVTAVVVAHPQAVVMPVTSPEVTSRPATRSAWTICVALRATATVLLVEMLPLALLLCSAPGATADAVSALVARLAVLVTTLVLPPELEHPQLRITLHTQTPSGKTTQISLSRLIADPSSLLANMDSENPASPPSTAASPNLPKAVPDSGKKEGE